MRIIWKFILIKNFISSVIFNFVYLPYHQAKYLPIWVSNLHFHRWGHYRGKIVIDSPHIYKRMIKLGVNYNFWYPDGGIKLDISGTIIFKGKCIIGNNSTIYIKEGCTLTIGDNVIMTSDGIILCECGIEIGDSCRLGWNTQMMDSDFHYMKNVETGQSSQTIRKPIVIGKNNWFGNGCNIFKGFQTADYVTIGSGSKCRGRIEESYTVWSNDGRLIKIKEGWYRDLEKDADYYSMLL